MTVINPRKPQAFSTSGALKKKLWNSKTLFIMCLPAIIYFIAFCYAPLPGIYVAFVNYNYRKGIFGTLLLFFGGTGLVPPLGNGQSELLGPWKAQKAPVPHMGLCGNRSLFIFMFLFQTIASERLVDRDLHIVPHDADDDLVGQVGDDRALQLVPGLGGLTA